MKMRRTENRSSRNPVTGRTTAIATKYPLITHCTVAAVTCRSRVSAGTATLSTVSLRNITNAATTSTPISSPVWTSRESGGFTPVVVLFIRGTIC
jgi:hypothetical protein